VFPPSAIETTASGNASINAAFTFGLASEDLPHGAYDATDPYFPMVVGVRVRKPVATGDGPAIGRRRSNPSRIILMYHRVGARGADPHRLSVSESAFRAQIAWLRASCSIVPLDELAECDTPSDNPAVALTFDDGYVDNLTVAAPVLQQWGLPATFFLTTEDTPAPYHYWWDRLAHSLLGIAAVPPTLTITLPSGRRTLETLTDVQRLHAHTFVYDDILRLPSDERDALIRQVSEWAGTLSLPSSDRRMTWSEAGELMSDSRFTIGAHTIRHLYLPAQPDHVVRAELQSSCETLRSLTGSRVDTLAYPFGAFDRRIVAAAREAGFRLAVTCEDRAVSAGDDRLALPRVEVTEDPLDQFMANVQREFGA
jgi:peptidoglycan/xylan/chitin deacetylase (PgdA/CDA1 family)